MPSRSSNIRVPASLAGVELKAGAWLSIDGRTGNMFLGRVPLRGQGAAYPGTMNSIDRVLEKARKGLQMSAPRTLGINGLGRIGKLTLWYHLAHDDFDRIVVNVGRPVGTSLQSVVEYMSKDSTYGPLHRYLGGCQASPDIKVVDDAKGLIRAHGKEIVVLREARNPKTSPGVTTASAWWSTAPASSKTRTPTPTTPRARCGATWPPAPGRWCRARPSRASARASRYPTTRPFSSTA